jgi:hypothetical protein
VTRPVPRFYPDQHPRIVRAIMTIALEVEHATRNPRTTCRVCGCLIAPTEACPRCRLDTAARNRPTPPAGAPDARP